MKQKSIMTRRRLNTRRKIIIYIVAMILILGIVSGFTNTFISDNRIFTAAFGETIVMEAEPPVSGSPEENDLISNLKYAAYKLHHASFFRGVTDGTVIADLGFTTYTQYIHNTRVVKGSNIVFAEAISSSSMKSVAEQKYADNGVIVYRPSSSISGSSATFKNSAYVMTYEDYAKKYGTIPNQLSKYIINEETVIGVKDENSKTKRSAKAATGDGEDVGFDFYVPDSLVADENGNYKFTLTLDPTASTLYYRNEVRTMAGADDNPVFYAVSLTVTIDANWNPISTTAVETYDIALPVLGAMNCTSRLTEVFTQMNDPDGVVPEQDFFQPYVDKALNDPNYVPPEIPDEGGSSPADYLAAAFADYLTGAKDLELIADIEYGDFGAYDLTLSVNINTLDIKTMLDDLFIGYSGDKVNIKLNDINGYLSVSEFAKLIDDEYVAALIDKIGGDKDFDITSLFGGDILGTVFKNCEMTTEDGVTRIHMPFALDTASFDIGLDKIDVDASIYVKDDGKVLQAITGDITIAGHTVSVTAKPLTKSPKFPSTDGAIDMSSITDFVPALLSTAMQKTYGIDGTIVAMGQTLGIAAYIDRTNGLEFDAVLTVYGQNITVKYTDGVLYALLGGIDVRGTLDDLPTLIQTIAGYTDMSSLDSLKKFMPQTVNDWVQTVKSLEVTDTDVTLGMNVLFAPITVKLTKAEGKISGLNFDFSFDKFGIKLDAAADLAFSEPESRDIVAPTGTAYITFAQLNELLVAADKYISHDGGYNVQLSGSATANETVYPVNGSINIDRTANNAGGVIVTASARLEALGQTVNVIYADDIAYITLGNIKLRLASSDIDALKAPATSIIDTVKELFTAPNTNELIGKAIDTVKSLCVDENGNLIIVLSVGDDELTATVDVEKGTAAIVGNIRETSISLAAVLSTIDVDLNITAPADGADYVDGALLLPALEKADEILQSKGATADIRITLGDVVYDAKLAVSFSDVFMLDLSIAEFRFAANDTPLPLDITVIDKTAYVSLGDVKAYGTTDDLTALFDAFEGMLPQNVADIISALLERRMPDIDIDATAVLDKALAAVTSLTETDGVITAVLNASGTEITIAFTAATTDIEVITAFGDPTVALDVVFKNLTAEQAEISVDANLYAAASEILPVVSAIIPLATNDALSVKLNGDMYGVKLGGTVYIGLGDANNAFTIKATLTAGDLPVNIVVKDGMLYLQIGGDIRVSEKITKQSVLALATELDKIIPGAKELVENIIKSIESMTTQKLIASVALKPTDNGFAASIDLKNNGIDFAATLTATNADGALASLDISCSAFGADVALAFEAIITDGVLSGLKSTAANVAGVDVSLGLTVSATEVQNIEAITNCVSLTKATQLIAPVLDIANSATGSNAITLKIGGSVFIDNRYIAVNGEVIISVQPFALSVSLALFDGTEYETKITIKYADNNAYIACGNIKLKLNTNTSAQNGDIRRIYDVISRPLPEYLQNELGMLLGLIDGESAFDSLSLLMSRIKQVADSDGKIETVIGLLFGKLDSISGKSAIATMLDMIKLFDRSGYITAAVEVLGITVNVTPFPTEYTEADGTVTRKIELITVDTTLFNKVTVKLNISDYTFKEGPALVAMPTAAQAAEYVSIAEFAETINYAINTFTTKTENGDITFELNDLNFDYTTYRPEIELNADGTPKLDENGDTIPVVDKATGRTVPLTLKDANGNTVTDANGIPVKVVDKKISVKKNANYDYALAGNFVRYEVPQTDTYGNVLKDEDGNTVYADKYRVNIAAHVIIDIMSPTDDTNNNFASDIGMPISLDLYVINNADNPDGIAFVDYMELSKSTDKNGNVSYGEVSGERISIGYNSALEIVAAVMNIVGVNDDTVNLLLGEYNQPIDKTVFQSMDIAGLDDIKTMLNGLADAFTYGKNAISDINEAWDIIAYQSESIDDLRDRLDDFKNIAQSALDNIKAAIAAFGSDDITDTGEEEQDKLEFGGKLFHDIVYGVKFNKTGDTVYAEIDNALTVQTYGTAHVAATQSNGMIKSVNVGGLDINTALLDEFTAVFVAGKEISAENNNLIDLPANYNSDTSKATYSDFGNIKHLLFDIMNTANLMEFEIGDLNATNTKYSSLNNQIGLKITTGVYNIEIVLNYSIKVKLIDQGENANPRYKTAATVELQMSETKGKIIAFIPAGVILPECTTMLYFYDNVLYLHGVSNWSGSFSVSNLTYGDFMYTLDDLSNTLSAEDGSGTLKLMNEFVYYLLPFSSTVKDLINKALDITFDDKDRTFAKVFKSYNYDGSNHSAVLGLKELTGVSVFNDANLSITGKNDSDDNLLDNYISHLNLNTKIVGSMVQLDVDAQLQNVQEYTDADGVNRIRSKGEYDANGDLLSDTSITTAINTVIGSTIPNTTWDRIWAS